MLKLKELINNPMTGYVTDSGIRSLTDTTKKWKRGQWHNAILEIIKGKGQMRIINRNNNDTVFFSDTWLWEPNEYSKYRITKI